MPAPSFALRSAARRLALLAVAAASAGCGGGSDEPSGPGPIPSEPVAMRMLGQGAVEDRYTAEVWVHGTTGYTSSWGRRGSEQTPGNTVYIWDVAGTTPQRVGTVFIDGPVINTGDVQVTDDGRLMVVATEPVGSLAIFDVADPRDPKRITRYTSPAIANGVHTAEVARVGGTLYAFMSVVPRNGADGRLVIADLSNPASPVEVYSGSHSRVIHDVFVRDGILFTALWESGLVIWDIGGGGKGGTPSAPVRLGDLPTIAHVHNVWWFHDPSSGAKRYAFVGEEGPGSLGASASGDIHVVDVTDMANPVEVAVYTVPGAGAHNFSMDEANGILYAAYYNGGVRALDVRGDLSDCSPAQRYDRAGRCDLSAMGREVGIGLLDRDEPVYVWGVHFVNGAVYASDMLSGLFKLDALP